MSAIANISSVANPINSINKEILNTLIKEAMKKEMLRRLSKAKWVTITGLLRRLCQYKGIIYGGAVRSYIQRVSAAQEYYAHCEQEGIDAEANYCCKDVHLESYENRNLFPNDIDVFICESDMDNFMMQTNGDYHFKKKMSGGAKYFFESNDLFKRALTLQKYETNFIHFCNSVLNSIVLGDSSEEGTNLDIYNLKIKIDFVIIKDDISSKNLHRTIMQEKILYPPFGNPDFDVNLLCFKADGEECGSDFIIKPLPILKRLFAKTDNSWVGKSVMAFKPLDDYLLTKSIIEDIVTGIREKRARPVFPILDEYQAVFGIDKTIVIDSHRIIKILFNGFSIDKFNLILEPTLWNSIIWASTDYNYDVQSIDNDEQEKCLICYDIFSANNRWFKCCIQCNGKMHQSCLSRYLNSISDSCPNCRTPISKNHCPCMLVRFLNMIDYVVKNQKLPLHKTCDDCSRFICDDCSSFIKLRACNCHTIDCSRCKHNAVPNIDID
jgi:hypothetical protein